MTSGQTYWVFGYGSLMWNPGFSYINRQKAVLRGAHRHFCIYSYHYRGTEACPGLVLGLDTGGSCEGIAYEVAACDWPETLGYLRQREQVTMVYQETSLPVELSDGRTIEALTYVADGSHEQYAGRLDLDHQIEMIAKAEGCAGPNRDYALNTLAHLREEGIKDELLETLCQRLADRLKPL